MKYKIKNKTRTVRKFREHRNPQGHWLRAGEEIIINNPPVVANPRVFEVTKVNNKLYSEDSKESKESYVKSSKKKKKKRTKYSEVEKDGTTRHME